MGLNMILPPHIHIHTHHIGKTFTWIVDGKSQNFAAYLGQMSDLDSHLTCLRIGLKKVFPRAIVRGFFKEIIHVIT